MNRIKRNVKLKREIEKKKKKRKIKTLKKPKEQKFASAYAIPIILVRINALPPCQVADWQQSRRWIAFNRAAILVSHPFYFLRSFDSWREIGHLHGQRLPRLLSPFTILLLLFPSYINIEFFLFFFFFRYSKYYLTSITYY